MDRRSNQFIEPDRGAGLIGWAVKQLAIWLVVGFVAYAAVIHRQGASPSTPQPAPRTALARADRASIAPAQPEVLRPLGQPAPMVVHSLTLHAQPNGHVLLTAEVNGIPVKFLVDTGATWVSLTRADAMRAGVAANLTYSIPMMTATGPAKAAPVMLRQVRIGQLEIAQVDATVMPEETGISLLGQTFLKRLQSYQMHGDVLTLSW